MQAVDFSETVVAYDIKVDVWNQLIDIFFINNEWKKSFIGICPGCLRCSICSILYSSKPTGLIETK